MANFELGIKCSLLVSMNPRHARVQQNQFIGINKNKIACIEKWDKQPCVKLIDASHHIVMPGLINGHTHIPMSLLRGLADDLPLHDWLFKNIFPVEAKLVGPDFVKCGSWLTGLEMIQSGTTTSCDMYYFPEVIAEVYDQLGLRGLLAQPMIDFKTPDSETPKDAVKRFEKNAEQNSNDSRIKFIVGPHAPYTCSDDTLRLAMAAAEKAGVPLSIHVSETQTENEESLKKSGVTPTKRLFDLGLMSQKSIFAHGVHLTDADIEMVMNTSTSLIHNPESNMKLGAGSAPIVKYLKAGMRVGLGTDGSASNNNVNIFGEMDSAAKQQKLVLGDNSAITAFEVLKMATIEGARALFMDKKIGSIELGKKADIICVDTNKPHMKPMNDPISQLVYSANGSEVAHVVCDGKVIMENYVIPNVDFEKIYRDADSWVARIQEAVK